MRDWEQGRAVPDGPARVLLKLIDRNPEIVLNDEVAGSRYITVDVPDGAGGGAVAAAVLGSVFTEPTVGLSLLTAVLALALTSANSPNWFALIADVNPPEHRGTVYSLGNGAWMYAVPVLGAHVLAAGVLGGRPPEPWAFALAAAVSVIAALVLVRVTTGLFRSERIVFAR